MVYNKILLFFWKQHFCIWRTLIKCAVCGRQLQFATSNPYINSATPEHCFPRFLWHLLLLLLLLLRLRTRHATGNFCRQLTFSAICKLAFVFFLFLNKCQAGALVDCPSRPEQKTENSCSQILPCAVTERVEKMQIVRSRDDLGIIKSCWE